MSRGRDDSPVDRPSLDRSRASAADRSSLNQLHRDQRELLVREPSLTERQAEVLTTVGAFRVVSDRDLVQNRQETRPHDTDVRNLEKQGLLTRQTLIDANGTRQDVLALTTRAKDLLDSSGTDRSGRQQEYYAGVVKPRELRHDAQIYRAYQLEAERIEAEGGRISRVVLDYELKRDYQRFLNRDQDEEADLAADRRAFADANDLSVIDGHLEIPDLRIEYETADGLRDHRDVEVVTEHYSRGQLSGKSSAGFVCYGANSKRGGTPDDPHHLERLS
jgi:hypothetical protein